MENNWWYYARPFILLGSAIAVGYGDYLRKQKVKKQNQQNATVTTDQQPTQLDAPQSQFTEMSNMNRDRLQKSELDSMAINFTPKPQENPQTIIMMPKEPKMTKAPKMPKPSKAQNYNPKEKLPHFCKAPNDGDMIKRY